jgi:hypothetical protein
VVRYNRRKRQEPPLVKLARTQIKGYALAPLGLT